MRMNDNSTIIPNSFLSLPFHIESHPLPSTTQIYPHKPKISKCLLSESELKRRNIVGRINGVLAIKLNANITVATKFLQ